MAANGDLSFTTGGQTVKIEGLRATLRSMEQAGTQADDLKDLMAALSTIVISAARPPRGPTGRLAGSLRPGRSKNKAVIRAGSARVPYAGVIHYGWPSHSITAQPFLVDALNQSYPRILAQFDQEINQLLRDNKLS